MHDRAHPGAVENGHVAADRIRRLELEPAPVSPHRCADVFLREDVGDLVRLDAVMERTDLVPELLRDVDHLHHFVSAIAVIVHENVAAQYLGKRLQAKVARGRLTLVLRIPFVPLAPIAFRLDPRSAVSGHVPHARGRPARRVHALGILPACHLEPVLRGRKLHSLRRARRHDLQNRATASDEVRRAGQHLNRRHPSGERPRKLRVLRPHRVFHPHVRSHRVGGFVDVVRLRAVVARNASTADVRVRVDDAGGDVLAESVDEQRVGGRRHRGSDLRDLAVAQKDAAVADRRARGREDGDVANERRPRGKRLVRTWKRIRIGRGHCSRHGSGVRGISRGRTCLCGCRRLGGARETGSDHESSGERDGGVTHRADDPVGGGWGRHKRRGSSYPRARARARGCVTK